MQKHVGYDTIVQALLSLLKDKRILDHTLGLILSTSQEDFSLSNVFATLRSSGDPNLKLVGHVHDPRDPTRELDLTGLDVAVELQDALPHPVLILQDAGE